jgi:DNA-binding LacI/PurR family transcriptional regulator
MKSPSIRAIADACGISVATVSRALRNLPSVPERTRVKVESEAKRLGYRPAPLVSAVLSSIRHARQTGFGGNLGFVFVRSKNVREPLPFQKQLIEGARAKAEPLGFRLGLYECDSDLASLKRLQRQLLARGVAGLIVINVMEQMDLSSLDWTRFTAVQFDSPLIAPALNTITVDHHLSLFQALQKMAARGYRRIGLFIELHKDERLRFRWSSAFLGYQNSACQPAPIPVLEVPALKRTEFMKWFWLHRPDLIVGHRADVLAWLKEEGVKVPEELGYLALNHFEAGGKCAGLDLIPEDQGALAVDTLVAQILRFERGHPPRPHTVMIEGVWREGYTVRSET